MAHSSHKPGDAAGISVASVQIKGLALEGIVSALKPASEKSPDLVPAQLREKYLDQELVTTTWYPLEDYLSLARLLASTLDPAKAKGDIYRAFGVIGAQRDVRGVQPNVPEDRRVATAGTYSGALAGVTGLATLVRRALHLRERYYSRGYYKVRRAGTRKLIVTLHDFPAVAELCAISTGYLTEVLRSAQVGAWVERLSCRGSGHADCRWEIRFAPETDVKDLAAFE